MKRHLNRRNLVISAIATPFIVDSGICVTQASAKTPSPSLTPKKTVNPMPKKIASIPAPKAKKIPHKITQLGMERTDDYAWMKDDRWQEVLRDPKIIKPDVKQHLLAENAYSAAMLASTKTLQATIFKEMKGRIKEDDSTLPSADGDFEYYSRYEKGSQHPITARRPRSNGAFSAPLLSTEATKSSEHILLNEELRSKGHDYYDTGGSSHSNDHKLFAWSEDTQGSEYYTIYVKEIASDKLIGTPIESSTGDFGFSPDGQWIFWTWRDENGRPVKIFRRSVNGGADTLVYEEKDPGFFIGVGTLSDESYIVISSGNQETSESWLIPANDPTKMPVCVEPRRVGIQYDIDSWGDHFVIRTNDDGAVDFKIMRSNAAVLSKSTWPSKSTWQEMIPHREGVFITGLGTYARHMVRTERHNANIRIVITQKSDLTEHSIDVKEEAYSLGLSGGYEYDTNALRFSYTSPTTPAQTFDYDMVTRERILRKTQIIPSGHDPKNYVSKRLFAKAADGQDVPITVLMKAGTKLDGKAPLLLYGYGSYGIPMESGFSIRNLSLVDRGFIYAVAHIRGGSEKGWNWFLDGRKFKKKNTFTDFIACAEHLISQKYATKGNIVAYGGSAGGMLMGAIANMRPDLWAGVIGAVPFIDVLNTMSDTSLPLTPPEWPEWGNPIEDKAAYDYIASYSPYENIIAQPYPPVLATGGLSDPRVTYWEPMKWISKLRDYSTSDAPMLLKINMEAGHGGASGRFDFLKEIAFDYAFAIWAVDKGWK